MKLYPTKKMQIDTTASTPTLNSFESPLNTAVINSKISKIPQAYKKRKASLSRGLSL
jgi:hypothetical protein